MCYTTALHQIITSAWYYIILLHQLDISIVLHQTIASAYYIRFVASAPCSTNHLITWLVIVKSMVEVLDFILTEKMVLICTYETSVFQTNDLYWDLIINDVPHHLTCLKWFFLHILTEANSGRDGGGGCQKFWSFIEGGRSVYEVI